jgi:hypothetical protein
MKDIKTNERNAPTIKYKQAALARFTAKTILPKGQAHLASKPIPANKIRHTNTPTIM